MGQMGQLKGKKAKFLIAFEETLCNVAQSCRTIKVARSTYYRWLQDPAFSEAILEAREGLIDEVESALLAKIQDGDMAGICFFLKCQGKGRGWVEKTVREPRWTEPIESVSILEDLLAGTIDITTAGFRYAKMGIPLPETVKILLSKAPQEEKEDQQVWCSMSMEEIDERIESGTLFTDEQERKWLTQRKADVKKLKEETKSHSSFDPATIDEAAKAV